MAFHGGESFQASVNISQLLLFQPTPIHVNHTTHHNTSQHITPGVCVKLIISTQCFFLASCLFPMGSSWLSNMEFLTECSVMEMERIPASTFRNGGRKGDKHPTSRLQTCARQAEYRMTVLSVCRHRISKQINKRNQTKLSRTTKHRPLLTINRFPLSYNQWKRVEGNHQGV